MKNFHVKSIILGIGIGFVLTSVISLIYTAGNTGTRMSNEEIIVQAKKLGMVEDTQLIKSNSNSLETKKENEKSTAGINTKDVKMTTPQAIKLDGPSTAEKPKSLGQEIKITVNAGESSEIVSEKLLKEGLITDKAAFLKELEELGLTSEINIGEFKIKTGTDTKSIIKIITGTR